MSTDNAPLLELVDVARYFDVSAPWLNRVLEGGHLDVDMTEGGEVLIELPD